MNKASGESTTSFLAVVAMLLLLGFSAGMGFKRYLLNNRCLHMSVDLGQTVAESACKTLTQGPVSMQDLMPPDWDKTKQGEK